MKGWLGRGGATPSACFAVRARRGDQVLCLATRLDKAREGVAPPLPSHPFAIGLVDGQGAP